MILSLAGTWRVNPSGPLRASEDAEDMWSLINSTASVMSGAVLSPWFIGESNDKEILSNGETDSLNLEFYSADERSAAVVGYLPSIMLAIKIGLEKAYESVELSEITVELNPGEFPASTSTLWWRNFFNQISMGESWDLTISPFLSGVAQKASDKIPYLFSADGSNLTSTSWGLMEAAALISIYTEEDANWRKIAIRGQKSGIV